MSVRASVQSPIAAVFKNERLLGSISGGVSLPLRGLAANNYGPQANQTLAVNVATTVEVYGRVQMVIGANSADLIVRFPNWFFQAGLGVKNPGNAMQVVEAAFEYGGTYKQLFFGGGAGITVANGDDIAADSLAASTFSLAQFVQGTTCWVRYRFRYSTPATDTMPHMGGGKGVTAGLKVDPTKVNFTNGVFGTGALAYGMVNGGVNGTDAVTLFGIYMPIMLGHHSSPVPMYVGDSKTYGTGDSAPVATGVGGLSRLGFTDATNASTAQFPQMNFGVPSGQAAEWSTAVGAGDITKPRAYMAYCTHGVVGYGTNALQTVQLQTIYGYFRAAGITKLIQRSLTPNATSTALAITGLTSTGTACVGTVASTAALVNGNTYTLVGNVPAAYNGSYVVTVIDGGSFSYTSASAPGGSSTTNGTIQDQFRTLAGQTTVAGWSVGGTVDTYEQTLRGWTSTDANLAYFQSTGERNGATTGTAAYWQWAVNGTPFYSTSDGKHESAVGYPLNTDTAGTITTQAGGTVSTSLRTYMPTWLLT